MEDNFIDLAELDNIPDQVLLEDGSTHEIQILKAEIGHSKETSKTAGQAYLKVMMNASDIEDCRPFTEYYMLPIPGLEVEDYNRRGRQLKEFFKAFEFDYASGWNIFEETSELEGLTSEATIRLEDDPEYGEQNSIRRWV